MNYASISTFAPNILRSLGLAALLIATQACVINYGPSIDDFSTSARGVRIDVTPTGEQPLSGELLEADSTGVVLLTDGVEIWRLSWSAIEDLEVEEFTIDHQPGRALEPADLEFLSSLSRFPPGLDDRQLEELLEFHGQDEVLTVAEHGSAGSPGSDADVEEFARTVREAVEQFRDVEEATLNGYRPIGPEFPGMGQHWVNAYILMRGGTDPARPPFLSYVTTPEGVRLTGIALGRVLMEGGEIADVPFPEAWHDHTHAVDIELLALNPDAAHALHADGVRLSMLHAWTELDNPAGLFAQDNWAVPFARLGLRAPETPSPEAGKALFLLSGGDDYYLGLITTLVSLDESRESAVSETLVRHRAKVSRLVDEDRMIELDEVWVSLWTEIEESLTPSQWEDVEILSR